MNYTIYTSFDHLDVHRYSCTIIYYNITGSYGAYRSNTNFHTYIISICTVWTIFYILQDRRKPSGSIFYPALRGGKQIGIVFRWNFGWGRASARLPNTFGIADWPKTRAIKLFYILCIPHRYTVKLMSTSVLFLAFLWCTLSALKCIYRLLSKGTIDIVMRNVH